MEQIERRVWREVRAMTRREVIIKAIAGQLSWVAAADSAGVSARQRRRLRYRIEQFGMSARRDQRGKRPRRKRISPGTIAMLIRLKRDIYPDCSLRHFYAQVTEKHQLKVSYNWLRLMLAGGRGGRARTGTRQVPAPARTPSDARHAGSSRRLHA